MLIRKVTGALIGGALMCVMAAPAAAQDQTLATASVGYLYFRGVTTCDPTVPTACNTTTKSYSKGLLLSASGRMNDRVSGLVEVSTVFAPGSGAFTTDNATTVANHATGPMKIWNIGTGIRVGSGSGKKWEAFGQFVVSWQRRSGKFILDNNAVQQQPVGGTNQATSTGSTSNDGLNLQPGAGIDFWLSKKMGVRVQYDFERVKADTATQSNQIGSNPGTRWTNNSRVVVSIVFQGVKK